MVPRQPRLTFWEAADEFLRDLARGDVCESPRYPGDEYYMRFVRAVCEGKDDVLELIRVKPYYPFILIAYYVLFHRHDLGLAGRIYGKLRELYEKYPHTFTIEEECALKDLGEVIQGLGRGGGPGVARRLGGGEGCVGWAALFRLLLQLRLDPGGRGEYEAEFNEVERSLPRLGDIYRVVEEVEREDDARYPGEVNYYVLLPLEDSESPIYEFIKVEFARALTSG